MASRRYTGTITDIHYDDRRGHATVSIDVRGTAYQFFTTRRPTAVHLESFFAVGDKGYIEADPNTLEIHGYGK